MKQNLKLWLLLVGIFCLVLCATLISCDKEAYDAQPMLIEPASTPPPIVIPDLRCCDGEDDDGRNLFHSKSEKTEDE
jgi:hypothetical protein